MKKILIIGQALPEVKQELPYDTTMLYDWLKEVGVSKEQAVGIFDFEAVFPVFPGRTASGGHAKPKKAEMVAHWNSVLRSKVVSSDKILLLGRVSSEFVMKQISVGFISTIEKTITEIPHPSRRNYYLYTQRKEEVLDKLSYIINS